jgi:hypothetical protein
VYSSGASGRGEGETMSNTLGYLRGELKDAGKTSPKGKKEDLGKQILEIGVIKKILLAIYNKIFSWYYS